MPSLELPTFLRRKETPLREIRSTDPQEQQKIPKYPGEVREIIIRERERARQDEAFHILEEAGVLDPLKQLASNLLESDPNTSVESGYRVDKSTRITYVAILRTDTRQVWPRNQEQPEGNQSAIFTSKEVLVKIDTEGIVHVGYREQFVRPATPDSRAEKDFREVFLADDPREGIETMLNNALARAPQTPDHRRGRMGEELSGSSDGYYRLRSLPVLSRNDDLHGAQNEVL